MQPLRFPRLLATCALLLTLAGPLCAQTNWTVRHEAAGTGGEFLWGVVEGANGIVTVGTGGKILHSADGRLWATRSSGFTGWLVAVAYGNGRYVAVGEGGAILTSPDGVTWARVAASGTTARLNNVLFAQNRFVAVGESGTLVTSVDGLAWSSLASGVGTAWLHGLAFGDGVWLTTGQGGAVSLSTDGVRWTRQTNSSVQDLEAVAFISLIRYVSDDGNHTFLSRTFLTVGAPGVALWCTYGVFTYENSPADNRTNFVTSSPLHLDYTLTPPSYVGGTASPARLRSLTNATDVLLATGEGGTVLSATSPHGPWKKVAVPTTKNLVAAGLVQGGFLLVGENETILQSEVIYHSRLGNLSTRGVASAGSGAMIAGTVIAGPRPAAILIRGLGPALTGFGVSGALADPVLTVFDQRGNPVATNSGWSTAPNAAFIAASAGTAGAFPLAPGSRDAALLLSLAPGNYTFQLGSAGNSAGNALIEAYILDTIDGTSPRPVNLATRGTVGTGDDLLIAGLVVQGQSARTVLVRGVGPGLGAFGVPGTLPDPLLKIIAADGTELATNDNWSQPTATAGRTF
ncbi:MAG: hypothetical protein NTV51_30325, partial [Verrucomicrobia bacterium]|nr:hypothetical protein [Verrucomicrobiota bacterium]